MSDETNREEEDRIRELRERYKKNPTAQNDELGEVEEEEDDDKRRKGGFILFLKYFAVFVGFFGFIALGVWITDSFIIPSYVHDKPIVEVPDLIGMNNDEAAELLASIGLQWEKNGEQFDNRYDAGKVLLQTPEAGLNVKAGRPIYLTISKGQERAKVPYLVGLTSREAMVELVSRGLIMGQIEYETSEMFDRDIVLSQDITNGKEVGLGDTIHLTVSKGSELTILAPELVGLDVETAKQRIIENGLLVGTITEQTEDQTFTDGTVLWQYPTAGNETLKGTYIDLIIVKSSGPSNDVFEELQNLWDDQ